MVYGSLVWLVNTSSVYWVNRGSQSDVVPRNSHRSGQVRSGQQGMRGTSCTGQEYKQYDRSR